MSLKIPNNKVINCEINLSVKSLASSSKLRLIYTAKWLQVLKGSDSETVFVLFLIVVVVIYIKAILFEVYLKLSGRSHCRLGGGWSGRKEMQEQQGPSIRELCQLIRRMSVLLVVFR